MSDSSVESPKKKRKVETNDSSTSSDDSGRRSSKIKKKSKHKKDKKHEKRKGKKKKRDKDREKVKKRKNKKHSKESSNEKDSLVGPELPPNFADASKNFAPMSKEQWEAKQSEVKRVFDEETGRYRLIKGDGEVLEEIVSRDRHKEINKQATMGDGAYFQTVLGHKKV